MSIFLRILILIFAFVLQYQLLNLFTYVKDVKNKLDYIIDVNDSEETCYRDDDFYNDEEQESEGI